MSRHLLPDSWIPKRLSKLAILPESEETRCGLGRRKLGYQGVQVLQVHLTQVVFDRTPRDQLRNVIRCRLSTLLTLDHGLPHSFQLRPTGHRWKVLRLEVRIAVPNDLHQRQTARRTSSMLCAGIRVLETQDLFSLAARSSGMSGIIPSPNVKSNKTRVA
jgi:hypothetical protein